MPDIIQPNNRGTQNVNQDIAVRYVSGTISHLEPNANPLTLIMKELGAETIDATKPEWFETERMPTETTLSANIVDGVVTTISVTNPDYIPQNALIRIQVTGETMLVAADHDGTNPVDVTRSWGTVAGQAATSGDTVTIFGSANEENALADAPRSVKSVTEDNQTEIKRDPFGISRTQQKIRVYTGDDLKRLRMERGIDHAVYKEHVAWFGEKAEVTGADFRRGSAGGLNERIVTNEQDFGGTPPTLDTMFDFAEDAFRYSSKGMPGGVKDLYVSRGVNSAISLIANAGSLRVMSPAKNFGINTMRFETPHGIWNIVSHPLFTGDTYGRYMFSVDPGNIKYAPLKDSDTMLRQNIDTPSRDGTLEEYLTEFSFIWRQERTHARGINVIA